MKRAYHTISKFITDVVRMHGKYAVFISQNSPTPSVRFRTRIRRRGIRAHTKQVKNTQREMYLLHKESARMQICAHIETCMRICKEKEIDIPPHKRIAIKHTVSRWGSCSQAGNLNFSYHLALIPPHLAEYVVVHEICHLREFNHSDRFWSLVEKILPDYRERKRELMNISLRA